MDRTMTHGRICRVLNYLMYICKVSSLFTIGKIQVLLVFLIFAIYVIGNVNETSTSDLCLHLVCVGTDIFGMNHTIFSYGQYVHS